MPRRKRSSSFPPSGRAQAEAQFKLPPFWPCPGGSAVQASPLLAVPRRKRSSSFPPSGRAQAEAQFKLPPFWPCPGRSAVQASSLLAVPRQKRSSSFLPSGRAQAEAQFKLPPFWPCPGRSAVHHKGHYRTEDEYFDYIIASLYPLVHNRGPQFDHDASRWSPIRHLEGTADHTNCSLRTVKPSAAFPLRRAW